jgi:hypothetical protein
LRRRPAQARADALRRLLHGEQEIQRGARSFRISAAATVDELAGSRRVR